MPDVKRFHKGISDITHLKTNRPKLHSLMQRRTFYPRLQRKPAGSPGRGPASVSCPVAAPCRPERPGRRPRLGRRLSQASARGWVEALCPSGPRWQENGPLCHARSQLEGLSWPAAAYHISSRSVFSPAGWRHGPFQQVKNHRSQEAQCFA